MQSLLPLLKQYFGFDSFRPLQGEIIREVVEGKDVLALMPTGGGKSVCFQLPALYLEGTAIVVSPLIALMKDQVESLKANGVPAASLNSSLPDDERSEIRRHCLLGHIKLLYISPEGIQAELNGLLANIKVSLIAIDEAHCISRWGHDFRPEYAQLAVLKERFPATPVIALTATADKMTRIDVVEQLRLSNPQIFIASFDRPNLSLAVLRGYGKKEKLAYILKIIRSLPGQSGIIYCTKRADTESLAAELRASGISAAPYHAGLPNPERSRTQDDFINDRIDLVCATIAFGMGIDKSNVRYVIHYNMPGSIENYYQEIGRAGRDGLPSHTLMFYSLADLMMLKRFAEDSGQSDVNLDKLSLMQRFCEADVCRRRILLNYFGEASEHDCGNCDVCLNPTSRFDGSILVQKALSAILRAGERIGLRMLIDILRASSRAELIAEGYHLLKTYGAGRDLPYRSWQEYIYQMIQLGYLEIDYHGSPTLKVTPAGRRVLQGEAQALLAVIRDPEPARPSAKEKKSKASAARTASEPASADASLVEALRTLRRSIAREENVPPYIIFSDASLHDMAQRKPLSLDDFTEVRGVGAVKLHKYGAAFIGEIRKSLGLDS
ncbi:MAG: DNA helicase RecQ [Tannerellaceae bacterium]|jgi:ATP-dependent DNA helicase RecQ|nr:DNA helicase RecQ [Tannerellaceae bacterium]